jgi:hypothetical protein
MQYSFDWQGYARSDKSVTHSANNGLVNDLDRAIWRQVIAYGLLCVPSVLAIVASYFMSDALADIPVYYNGSAIMYDPNYQLY